MDTGWYLCDGSFVLPNPPTIKPTTARSEVENLQATCPNSSKTLKIQKRLGQKSAPSSAQSFHGCTSAVYLAKIPSGQNIALKVVYSFLKPVHPEANPEIEIHKFLCSQENSKRFILQFYRSWEEKIDFFRFPDWNADQTLINHKSLFIATEYIPMNLLQFRNLKYLTQPDILVIVYQIAKGIEFLQQPHVVHRDLKPDNILMDEVGRPLIFDFGEAIQFSSDLVTKPELRFHCLYVDEGFHRGGALRYLPPEIRNAKPGEGVFLNYKYCDIYALGIIIYNLFGHDPPLGHPFPEIPKHIRPLVSCMVGKERFPNAQAAVKKILDVVSSCIEGVQVLFYNPCLEEIHAQIYEGWEAKFEQSCLEADRGDPVAQFTVGMNYLNPKLGPNSHENQLAIGYLEKAANQGHEAAQVALGESYFDGNGVEKDQKLGLEYLTRATKKDSPLANFFLGRQYLYGNGVPKNIDLATQYLSAAANARVTEAEFYMGVYYANGSYDSLHQNFPSPGPQFQPTPENGKLALLYFSRAAEKGHALAQAHLGCCFMKECGTPKDESKAVSWFRKAADLGEKGAQGNMGDCHVRGYGVEIDEKLGLQYWGLAAENGLPRAQYNMAVQMLTGEKVPRNTKKALAYLQAAAKKGHANSQLHLAFQYQSGLEDILPKNEETAFEYFMKAAQQQHPRAEFQVALAYEYGQGVKKDKRAASEYYIKAAAFIVFYLFIRKLQNKTTCINEFHESNRNKNGVGPVATIK
jgi:TPR repeat protein